MDQFITGWFVGISQEIIGHPMDTLKVRVQNNMQLRVPAKNYFRGIQAPLLTTGIINSLYFGIENEFRNKFQLQYYQSGALSGLITSLALCPIENWKTKMQVGHKFNLKPFKGLSLVALRETTSMSVYFGLYHKLSSDTNIHPLIIGGITGWVTWLNYPLDVLKTRIQSDYTLSIKQAIGKKFLWKGFLICSIRAVLLNSIGFWIYSYLSK